MAFLFPCFGHIVREERRGGIGIGECFRVPHLHRYLVRDSVE
jgi:hypothetical protein